MALKQSAFNFDFEPEEKKPDENHMQEEQAPSITPASVTQQETVVELEDIVVYKPTVEINESIVTAGATKKSPRGRMKLSDMNAGAELVEVPSDEVLFEKSYYSIGAVSNMFKVNQSLIRFWENEFSILKPKKNAKGDRFFRPEDVKNLKLIFHLLRERKYTIEGAKEFLKKSKNADKKFEMIESLKNLQSFLYELKANM